MNTNEEFKQDVEELIEISQGSDYMFTRYGNKYSKRIRVLLDKYQNALDYATKELIRRWIDNPVLIRHSVAFLRDLYLKNPFSKPQDYLFDNLQLHPEIRRTSEELFKSGHFAQAIFEAFKTVNNMVKSKSKCNRDGSKLMSNVFKVKKPIIELNELSNQSDVDEQEGFMHIFMGSIQGIRNPKAHETVIQKNPYKTLEYLSLASLLAKRVDEGKLSKE